MAALAPGAAGAAGGGGDWTVLVPTAMAAEWTALTLPGGRARAPAAAARGGSGGGGVPEVALEMAALLTASGAAAGLGAGEGNGVMAYGYGGEGGSVPGHGVGGGLDEGGASGRVAEAGRPYFVPVVFVPSIKAKEEDIRTTAAKVIYGLLLFGPLAYVIPTNNALQARKIDNTLVWQPFGVCWGLLSIGFHLSLHRGLNRAQRAYSQHVAHFSLMLFCLFVVFYLYLLLPPSTASLFWLIEMESLLVVGHLGAWLWIVLGITVMPPKPSTGYKRGTQASQEGLPVWSRHVWNVVKRGLHGVTTRCCAEVRDGWPRVWAKIRQVCSGRRKRRSAV